MKKTQREYKVIGFPPLTAEDRALLEKLDKMPDSEINYEDIPKSTPESAGGFYYFQSLKIPTKSAAIRQSSKSSDFEDWRMYMMEKATKRGLTMCCGGRG